jgi:Tol biopolymer transport system component/DNA-binding winged helix-turn-helix (wHTH) protein
MFPQATRTPKLTFGPFEYDSASGELWKHGHKVRLPSQPRQVLDALLARPGELIAREELRLLLWPGATAGDFEHGLNAAVNKLRQALGDSADQPRYVETVAGRRGYRFVAPVHGAPGSAPVLEMPSQTALRIEPKPVRPRLRLTLALCGLALIALSASGYWLANRSPAAATRDVVRFSIHPPAGFALEGAASRQSLSLSPDGSKLAFTAMDTSGAFSLFVRDFKELESRKIPGTEGAHTMFWPRNGQSLYFTAKGKLWRAPLEGDANVLLAESPPFMSSGLWLSPERLLIGARGTSFTVASTGGSLEKLSHHYAWPQLLPDGKHLLCLMPEKPDVRTSRRHLCVVRSSDLAVVKNLFQSDTRVQYIASTVRPETGYLLYVRAGVLLAQPFDPRSWVLSGDAIPVARSVYQFVGGAADFSVSEHGVIAYQSFVSRSHLAWVDRAGRELGTIGPANVNVKAARLSPDGKWAAAALYELENAGQDLWLFDIKTNAGRRLSDKPALRDSAVWSPDSKKVVYLYGARDEASGLRLRGVGEVEAEETTPAADFQIPLDWSPDGRFIAFMNVGLPRFVSEQQSDVNLIDLAQGKKIVPLLNSRFHESWGAFSPDGKWFAFTSNESGTNEVYVQAFRAGDSPGLIGLRYRVSKGGGSAIRWRRDGRELYFLDGKGVVRAVPAKLGTQPEFGSAETLFTISTEARAAIHSLPGFDVSANGSRFVVPAVSAAEGPSIVVIQNWEELLPASRPQ